MSTPTQQQIDFWERRRKHALEKTAPPVREVVPEPIRAPGAKVNSEIVPIVQKPKPEV